MKYLVESKFVIILTISPSTAFLLFFLISLCEVRLSPRCTSATLCRTFSATGDGWCRMRCSQLNENWQTKPKYSRKFFPLPIWQQQIPHDLTSARTVTTTVRSRWLSVWGRARPYSFSSVQTRPSIISDGGKMCKFSKRNIYIQPATYQTVTFNWRVYGINKKTYQVQPPYVI
jgi:hypothetical protein